MRDFHLKRGAGPAQPPKQTEKMIRKQYHPLPCLSLLVASLLAASCGGDSGTTPGNGQEADPPTEAQATQPAAHALEGYTRADSVEYPVVFRHADFDATPEEDRRVIVFHTEDGLHGWLQHENTAASILLGERLAELVPGVEAVVLRGDFPDAELLERAATVVFFGNGTEHHAFNEEVVRERWRAVKESGVGAVGIHWALEAEDPEGEQLVAETFGGFFELHYSVNPMWLGEFEEIPEHQITRGIEPFKIYDEFYFNIRFPEELPGTRTDILTAVPPRRVILLPEDGPRSNNEHVRASEGVPQVIAWTYERPSGGRSYSFCGTHFHWCFKDDTYRRLMLQGIAWTAEIEIPEEGFEDRRPTDQEMMRHQDNDAQEDWRPMPGQPPLDDPPGE